MRSRVAYAVFFIIMRQIFAVFFIESKFKNFHPRPSGFFHEFGKSVRGHSEVFCNKFKIRKPVVQNICQCLARPFFPCSVFRCFFTFWNCPIFIQSSEMVNSYHIIKLFAACDSSYPPSEPVLFLIFPVIKRISPQLSRF